jgi:hypothetical protein
MGGMRIAGLQVSLREGCASNVRHGPGRRVVADL